MRHLLALGLLLLVLFSHAQETIIGLKVGPSYVNMAYQTEGYDGTSNRKFAPFFHVGGFARIPVNSQFHIQQEVLYSMKGYHFDPDHYTRLNYVSLPLLLSHQANEKLLVSGGVELGYLISAKSGNNDVIEEWKQNNIDVYRFETGVLIDFQYLISEKIGISARYIHGITAVTYSEVTITDEFGSTIAEIKEREKNRAIQLSFNFRLLP